MTDKKENTVRATVRAYKIGDEVIYGTDQDFPESPVEKLSVAYEEDMERIKRKKRRLSARNPPDVLRNRFDRMKSYCTSRKIEWNLDFEDYKRLWEESPEVFDPEKGRMVPAIEYSDRRGKLRACREHETDRVVDANNLVLKNKSQIHCKLRNLLKN